MTPTEQLTRILTLHVHLRDEAACAEITPDMVAAYLRGKGWTLAATTNHWHEWTRDGQSLGTPREGHVDYGRRMVTVIRDLAGFEERSPLAIWLEIHG